MRALSQHQDRAVVQLRLTSDACFNPRRANLCDWLGGAVDTDETPHLDGKLSKFRINDCQSVLGTVLMSSWYKL